MLDSKDKPDKAEKTRKKNGANYFSDEDKNSEHKINLSDNDSELEMLLNSDLENSIKQSGKNSQQKNSPLDNNES